MSSNNSSPSPKPSRNSLKNDINRLHKSGAKKLLFDDFNSKHKVDFEGNYKNSKSKVQFKSSLAMKNNKNGCTFNLSDETRLDFNLSGNNTLRLKMKPSSLQVHVNGDHMFYKFPMYFLKMDCWSNPYMLWDTNRDMTDNKLSVGVLSDGASGMFYEDIRVQIQKKDGRVEGGYKHNLVFNYNDFVYNHLFSGDVRNWTRPGLKSFSLEYKRPKWSLGVEMAKRGESSLWEIAPDNLDVGVLYKHNKEVSVGLWSKTGLADGNTVVSAGVESKPQEKVRVKARVDSNKDIDFFASYRCCKFLEWQLSLATSIDSNRLSEVYGNGAKVGLKVKFDN